MMKKRILVLLTGGTLASTNAGDGLFPSLSSKEIFNSLVNVTQNYNLDYKDVFSIDSTNLQLNEWIVLANIIDKSKKDYSGIVIIHGTDTMAYTASALTFMLQGITIPVVLTGSQLSIANPIADATENCRSALYMAGSGISGVYIAFNRKLILGVRASKMRTISFDAFESINYPIVAEINSNGLQINPNIEMGNKVNYQLNTHFCSDIFLLKLIPGMRTDIFEYLLDSGYKAVIIEGFGIGNIPSSPERMYLNIKKLVENGITVIVKSQCPYEASNMNVYLTGKKVLNVGAISSLDMTTEACVTKLMWILGQTREKNEIIDLFYKNIAGEICSK